MRKLLLSAAVVVAAILAPTAVRTYTPDVVHTTSYSVPNPDLPVLRHAGMPTPAASVVQVQLPGISSTQPVTTHAVAPSGGISGTTVTGGAMSTPDPPTCSGVSMSKSSSDNGMRSRTRHQMSNCGDSCDSDDPCDN